MSNKYRDYDDGGDLTQLECGCWCYAEDGYIVSPNPYCRIEHGPMEDDDDATGA